MICHLSELPVEQCACRVHGPDVTPHRKKAIYGLPLPAPRPVQTRTPARPVILIEPVNVGLLDTTAAISSQIRHSAGEIHTLWPHLTGHISGARTEARVTGSGGILADDDSPRTDDLPRVDSLVDTRAEIAEVLAFWARVAITEKPIDDISISAHDVPGMARLLCEHAAWISGHEVGDECADDLRRIARTMYRVIVGTATPKPAPVSVNADTPVVLLPTAQLVRDLPAYGYDITEGHLRVMLHRGEVASSGVDDSGDRLWDLWAVLYALGKRGTRRTA